MTWTDRHYGCGAGRQTLTKLKVAATVRRGGDNALVVSREGLSTGKSSTFTLSVLFSDGPVARVDGYIDSYRRQGPRPRWELFEELDAAVALATTSASIS